MMRLVVVAIVLVAILVAVPGCGFLISKLPKVKLQPASGQKQTETKAETSGSSEATSSSETSATPSSEATPKDDEPASETVVKGTLPKPAGGGSSGGRVRFVPVGAQRTLSSSDLSGMSKWQLDVLRNEIYAAHGRTFERSDLQNYFDRQTWYNRDSGFSENRLSSLEKRNAAFIADYQKGRGQVGGSSRSSGSSSRRSSGGGSQWVSTGFVLPFSSDRRVTSSDLGGLSRWELDVARNEIYARHGRPFKRGDLRNYFRGQAWYSEDSGYSDGRLSRLEAANAETIRQYQR